MATPPRPPDKPTQSQSQTSAPPPHAPPPSPAKHDEPAKRETPGGKPPPEHANPSLTPENATALYKNGHRIAKQGDPPSKWVSMGRLADGTPVHQTPMTDDIVKEIEGGEYYLAEGAKEEPETASPAPAPTSKA